MDHQRFFLVIWDFHLAVGVLLWSVMMISSAAHCSPGDPQHTADPLTLQCSGPVFKASQQSQQDQTVLKGGSGGQLIS